MLFYKMNSQLKQYDERCYQGFTLIELLVVIVIIGIILTFATLSIEPSATAQVEREAKRLTALLNLASQEAVLQGKELGVSFSRQDYRFYILTADSTWQLVKDRELFHPYRFPEGLHVELRLDGQPVALHTTEEKPQFLLLSSGERTAFDITFTTESASHFNYQISGTLLGTFKLNYNIIN